MGENGDKASNENTEEIFNINKEEINKMVSNWKNNIS